jgi:HEPN domain-containing protein
MPRDDSPYPKDWLDIAERDLTRVRVLLDANDPEGAGFHLQQALEKFLKAFLLYQGWKLRRIHDLEALLNEAIEWMPELEGHRSLCQRVTAFYFIERYPFISEGEITKDDVNDSLSEAHALIDEIRCCLDSK